MSFTGANLFQLFDNALEGDPDKVITITHLEVLMLLSRYPAILMLEGFQKSNHYFKNALCILKA